MAKIEFRALKSAFELKKITQNELIQLKIELGQTVNIAKNTNGTIKKYLPIATIAEFDDVERNLEYSDFYNEMVRKYSKDFLSVFLYFQFQLTFKIFSQISAK